MIAGATVFKRSGSGFLVASLTGLLWAIAIAVCSFPASSEPVPIWATFTKESSELPDDYVMALARGADGVLWIGTAGGLAQLDKDGRWQTYNKASTNGGLPDDRVWTLKPERDGALWIGTAGGLARLDKDGRWQTYNKASTNGGLPHDGVRALAVTADGALWIGTDGGLARLDNGGHWQTYRKVSAKGRLPDDRVWTLALDADGALWVGTDDGLVRLDKDGRRQTYGEANTNGGLPDDWVKVLAAGADGALWIGTGRGVTRLDKDGRWETYSKANTNGGLPDDSVKVLVPGADGTLWIGTEGDAIGRTAGGLARLNRGGHWQTYSKANTNGALPGDSVNALAIGADGALWIGTGRGVTRLDKDGRWETYSKANTNGGLPDDSVNALARSADGALWIGTGRGVTRLVNDGGWQTYSMASTNGDLPDDRVWKLAPRADGALWIGTEEGLARLDKDGRWQTYSTASTNGVLPNNHVTALVPGADGALWIGTVGGLARLDKNGHWQTYSMASTNGGLPDDRVWKLAPGADGALWIGTAGGLARLDKAGRWQTYSKANTNGGLPADPVRALALGADGALWIGTGGVIRPGGGLTRLNNDGRWQTYTTASTNGGLPTNRVNAMVPASDGALWIGTGGGGLARLGNDGRWQTYSQISTDGGLPDDDVRALMAGTDGGLWIGTSSGLGYLRPPTTPEHRIVEVIGESTLTQDTQQTISVVTFDGSYRTPSWLFRYVWRVTEQGMLADKSGHEIITRSPVFRASFDHDGDYLLQVNAIDRYGEWSEPRDVRFRVKLPKSDPIRATLLEAATWLASSSILYLVLIFPLIRIYPRYSWARSAINSGAFTKFPILHKTILNTVWARHHLFRQLAEIGSAVSLPKPYIQQSLFLASDKQVQPIVVDGRIESLKQLFGVERRALLIARSGTGKSVLLHHLQQEVAARFLRGERVPAPVSIDLRTHVLRGREVQALVRDVLRGACVELTDGDLDFLIRKGGFLILVDSLNELPDSEDARLFHTFFNQDVGNFVLIASQMDLIRRQDTSLLNLAEVTPEQAAAYLLDATGHDAYANLPAAAQTLARNPQDLVLLAEVITALGVAGVPTGRAELYREMLNQDGALRPWVESDSPLLATIYSLAFRMIAERRVLSDRQLREWIASESIHARDAVAKVINAIRSSRLFRQELERDILGKEQPVTGFRHELIGKFLAARHVRRIIEQGAVGSAVDYISLSGDELWLDMFYFIIDEIDSSLVLNRFLQEILAIGGSVRLRITAYAIGTKREKPSSQVLASYDRAKLDEDLALTPAAA
jgi:ligand-binding sensor domain-containing protein